MNLTYGKVNRKTRFLYFSSGSKGWFCFELAIRNTSGTPGLPFEDLEVLLSDGSDADASLTA